MSLIKVLKLWPKMMKRSVMERLEYKTDFVIGMIAMILTNMMSIVFFWVVYGQIETINGWTLGQALFLIGLSALSFGVWGIFLAGSTPWRLEKLVIRGDFDRILLRPFGTLSLLATYEFDTDNIGDFITGIVLLVIASDMIGINWGLLNLLLLGLFVLSGALIIFSAMLFIASLTFWITKVRPIADALWIVYKITEYPMEIYSRGIVLSLTFLFPIAFISYYPTQVFIGEKMWFSFAYLSPVVAILFFGIAYAFWRISLKRYSSTGS